MKKAERYVAISIILVLGLIFNFRYLNEFPSYTHAWAQSDRYALSLGFVKNDLNLAKPQTFVLNHQFPDDWTSPSNQSITAVDFPIHDYIPAIVMKMTGVHAPFVFRIYTLLYSFIGLFFLFKLAHLLTKDFYKACFVLFFAATSPVFVFYQAGFLPTIPSFANAVIGIYFYCRHLQTEQQKHFNLAILFLTLATLSRMTFAIPLIAVLGVELIRLFKHSGKIKSKIIPVIISVSVIAGYLVYNSSLRTQYGSIFLSHLMPAKNLSDAKAVLKMIYTNWGTQYFSKFHYLLFFVCLACGLFFLIRKKVSLEKHTVGIWLLTFTIFIGCIAFAFLMLLQFPAHDYYFLDTFFLPVLLVLILLLSLIPPVNFKYRQPVFIAGLLLVAIPLTSKALSNQQERRTTGPWDRTTATIENFRNSDIFLDSLKISRNAKILVVDAYAPNIPLILMDRKGFAIMKPTKENIQNALTWKFDYVVVQNDFFVSDIISAYPEILKMIEKVADNGKITICKLSKTTNKQTLTEFLGLENKTPVFEKLLTYDQPINDKHWENAQISTDFAYSGSASGKLSPDMEYGVTYKIKSLPALVEKSRTLLFSSYFWNNGNLKDCELVVSLNDGETSVYYKSYNLRSLLKTQKSWEKLDLLFQLPQVKSEYSEIAIFLWNTGKGELYTDDFGFRIY